MINNGHFCTLCVILLGRHPSFLSPQRNFFCLSTLFIFLASLNSSTRCFTGGRDAIEHAIGVASNEFLLELCRAGSIGWDRHPFAKDVHQKPYLGARTGLRTARQTRCSFKLVSFCNVA